MFRRLAAFAELVKLQHTLFALPFAVLAAARAAGGAPAGWQIGWLLAAMVTARSAAMAFNRIADRRYDAANPRTADRPIPRGALSIAAAAVFTLVMVAGFVLSAARLNLACLYLTPVALVVVLGYSYAKRFTALSHLWLGLSLSIAPAGAWIGVRGALDEPYPFLLAAAVVFWTAGFDIIYACLDVAFDRSAGLRSVPARIGVKPALRVSAALHALFAATLVALGVVEGSGWPWWAGVGVVAALLVYEHAIVEPDDLKRVNEAFFRVNAVVSAVVMGSGLAGLAVSTNSLRLPADDEVTCLVARKVSVVPEGWAIAGYDNQNVEFIWFSPNGRRVAYQACQRPQDDMSWLIVDGSRKARYRQGHSVRFSPDGTRLALCVHRDIERLGWGRGAGFLGWPWVNMVSEPEEQVLLDGQIFSRFGCVLEMTFSPAGNRFGCAGKWTDLSGTRVVLIEDLKPYREGYGPGTPIRFSHNGRRVAHTTHVDNGQALVVDGAQVLQADTITGFGFVDAVPGWICTGMRGQTAYAWRGDSHEGPYEWIDEPVIAANNKSYAYYARTDGDDFVVLNGIRQRPFRSLMAPRCLTLSQDGRHAAYHAREGDAHYVVLDGEPVDHQDTRGRAVRIRLSPDGRRLAYGIWNQTSNHLWWVVDSLTQEEFDFNVTALHFVFSPDSRHWAYTAYVKGLGWRVIVDGKPSEWMDWIDNASLVFSPDGRKLAYGARQGRELWWKVVDVK